MNTLSDGYPHLVGVDNWEQNQISFKPDANATLHGNRVYAYDSGPSNNPYPLGERCFLRDVYPPFYQRQVTDLHESMSHVARPRSKAIGAEPNSSVVFATSIDLAAQYGFGRARSDHSGQFERRIQQVHDFYTSIVDAKATILLTAVILGLAAAGLSWFRGYSHSVAPIRHELTDATVQHAKTSSVLPVSQNHSNGSNAYPKSSVSAPSLEAATDAYIEKIRRDPEYQWKMPINFFGKVVDQYDNPIAGAAVHFQWVNLRGSEGVEEADTMTDAEGRFSLQGKNGKNLGVSVSKDGYYHASPSENQLNFEYASR